MARFVIGILTLWLGVGGCGAPIVACPLVAAHHDDCCQNKSRSSVPNLKDCPVYAAAKAAHSDADTAAPPDGSVFEAAVIAPMRALQTVLIDQHEIHLSNRVLRI